MKLLSKIYFSLLLLFFANVAFGQGGFGSFPLSFKWYYVSNDATEVIFPKGLENQALRVASYLDLLSKENLTAGAKPPMKVRVILKNQTTISNGFVQLAPFKSEFFLTPFADSYTLGSLPWIDLLSIHEYRHVMQYSNSRVGLSKVASILLGQSAWSILSFFAAPNWYWEGDAVITETAYTKQGRGRLPEFYNGMRSLELRQKRLSYMTMRNGSYNKYVPDHYRLGFLMNAYNREKYGKSAWTNVFKEAVSYTPPIYPFSFALLLNTGKNSRGTYHATMDYFGDRWKNELKAVKVNNSRLVTALDSKYTSYRYPHMMEDGNIIALKSSYDYIPTFVIINPESGEEQKVRANGIASDEYFSYKNHKLVWTELRFHPRWGDFDYSVIKIKNLKNENTIELRSKTKYFGPSLSHSDTSLVAVHMDPQQRCELHLLSYNDSAALINTKTPYKVLQNPDSLIYTYPMWSSDDMWIIAAARNSKGEMAIVRQHIESQEIEALTPFTNHVMAYSLPTDEYVYFDASYSGIDNIYRVHLTTKKIEQITSGELGSYQPCVSNDGSMIYFSEFHHNGDRIKAQSISEFRNEVKDIIPLDQLPQFHYSFIKEDAPSTGLDDIVIQPLTTVTYSPLRGLINVHSWSPIIGANQLGLGLNSTNVLNNFEAGGSFSYQTTENIWRAQGGVVYGSLPVWVGAGYRRNFQREIINKKLEFHIINENIPYVSLSLPLNLTKGRFIRQLLIGAEAQQIVPEYTHINGLYSKYNTPLKPFTSLGQKLIFANVRRSAQKNIYSHFGQYIEMNFLKPVNQYDEYVVDVKSEFAFPGFLQNHNFVAGFEHFESSNNTYRYLNTGSITRGYQDPAAILTANYDALSYMGFYKFTFNYHFPLCYPNFGFFGLIHYKRVRANVFYDILQTYNGDKSIYTFGTVGEKRQYNSYGVELIFDNSYFNIAELPLGFRYIERENLGPTIELLVFPTRFL